MTNDCTNAIGQPYMTSRCGSCSGGSGGLAGGKEIFRSWCLEQFNPSLAFIHGPSPLSMDTNTTASAAEHTETATMASASHDAPVEASTSQTAETSMHEDRASGGTRGNRGHTRDYSRGSSKGCRTPGARTRRSDMGRAQWRYLPRRYLILSLD